MKNNFITNQFEEAIGNLSLPYVERDVKTKSNLFKEFMLTKLLLIGMFLALGGQSVFAQTFSAASLPSAIPDPGDLTRTITVSGLSGTVATADEVQINVAIDHAWASDIVIGVTPPGGTEILIVNRIGGGVNIDMSSSNTLSFRSNAAAAVTVPGLNGVIPAGIYLPSGANAVGSFSSLVGATRNGDWIIRVRDDDAIIQGSLASASITFNTTVSCTGNVPIQNLANGMNYTIVSGQDGTVNVSLTVVDNPVGMVGFFGGPGNPISFPNAMGTFTYSFTGQTVGAPFVVNMFLNWAAGGQGSSQTISIIVGGSCTAPTPPSQPVGFVAQNPSSSSAFLAVGPNNVGANNIVYRLYYSPTASAPANPLNATQHTFGSIPGDGNGTAAFGFNLGGLTASTPYTFWLYQYNTASMLYSAPAVATLTTLSPPALPPTTNAPNPTCPAANVVSIYGDFYSPNIATNYNPNWGQSGFALTNPNYDPGTGNVILAYRNFNYQGTDLIKTNLSSMQFLNFDVWTDANPTTTTLQVSPINQGTGPAEVLVTVPYVRGQWTRISLPKSAFGGMTWDGVFQMKFAANGPGSLVPVDIYLDNIFFSTTNCGDVTPPTVNCSPFTVTFNGQNSIQLLASQLATASDASGPPTLTLSPNGGVITCQQVGQQVPVTVTAMDANNNTATCISTVTVAGLPCGWSQNSSGVNCTGGNSIAYNPGTGVWTATSTNCYYASPYTADETAFAQRTLCGNGSITALVTDISGTALGWAGVVMRESSAAGAKKAQLMTNLSNFSRREFRTTTNGSAIPQQFPSQTRYWLRIVRTGNQFAMYVSPNGTAWYFVGAQNIVMSNCIEMGLAVTNYVANSTVTATFSNVSFTGSNPIVETGIGQSAQSIDMPQSFNVYPNPTGGELNVDLTQYIGRSVRLEVYSLEGKLLQFSEIDEVQTVLEMIHLNKYETGMYLVKVKSAGVPDATQRVVLQRR